MTVFQQLWNNVYLRFIILALGLYVLYRFMLLTGDVWVALVVSYLIAYLLNPFVSWIEEKTNRVVGMIILFFTFLLDSRS